MYVEAPSALYVRYLVKKVKETGILIDKPKREKQKTVRTPGNIAALAETALRQIAHKDPGTMPYIGQLVQELKPIDTHNAFSLH